MLLETSLSFIIYRAYIFTPKFESLLFYFLPYGEDTIVWFSGAGADTPARVVIGRGRGRACTTTSALVRATTLEPLVAPVEEQVHDYMEPEMPAQIP